MKTAISGEECLELAKDEQFHVVLLDLKMPGLDGMEVLRLLHEMDPNVTVIVITGYATVEAAVEAMRRGAYDFIPKPFTPDQLRIVVRRAVEKLTLQLQAEFLLRERERDLRDIATEKSRLQTIVTCMADGVLVTDRDGNVVLYNPAAARLLKVYDQPIQGQPLHSYLKHPELAESITKVLNPEGGSYHTVSQEIALGESGEVFLRAHLAPVRNEGGEILGSVTVLQDISQLKAMDQMKSDFVAMVSHELRSPLTSIQQQLSVILGEMVGEITDKQRELLQKSKEKIGGLLALINNLLDLSRIEAGVMVHQKEPLQLAEILQRTVDLIRPRAEAKGITLELSLDSELPLVNADRDNMEQVFINLVSNAITYTPGGGRVEVCATSEGDHLCVEVTDTGIGIQEEDLPRIFDKFYRVKTDRTRHIIGTGLGLSIVKGIVEAHLGSIQVKSQVGKGSTFTVLLPRGS